MEKYYLSAEEKEEEKDTEWSSVSVCKQCGGRVPTDNMQLHLLRCKHKNFSLPKSSTKTPKGTYSSPKKVINIELGMFKCLFLGLYKAIIMFLLLILSILVHFIRFHIILFSILTIHLDLIYHTSQMHPKCGPTATGRSSPDTVVPDEGDEALLARARSERLRCPVTGCSGDVRTYLPPCRFCCTCLCSGELL